MYEIFCAFEEMRATVSNGLLVQALDYWHSITNGRSMPSRRDIDPMEIPALLPTTYLIAADKDGQFRYQLAGTRIEERYQLGPVKGKTPQEIVGEAADTVLTPYRRVRDEGVFFYREGNLEWVSGSRKFARYRALLMPLSDDGQTVNMIFGVHEFLGPER